MRSYAAVVFVSMLSVTVVSGQCTNKYSGLKQCTILNGATTKASDTTMMSLIDAAFDPAYKSMVDAKTFTDSEACKTAYAAYNCILIASTPMMNSAPCDASGAPMLPCHELCTAYVQACMAPVGGAKVSDSDAKTACNMLVDTKMSAAKGATCFGTAGNKGMASGASSLTVSSYITALASTVVAFAFVTVA